MNAIEVRIEACRDRLEARCREADLFVSGDLRVSETHAAQLLGIAPGSLKAMRQEGKGPIVYRIPINGCRLSYRLDELASWIERGREDFQ